jgi:hypothetical protein
MFEYKTKADQLAVKRGLALTRNNITACLSALGAMGVACEYAGGGDSGDVLAIYLIGDAIPQAEKERYLDECRVITLSPSGEKSLSLRDAVEFLTFDLIEVYGLSGFIYGEGGGGTLEINSSGHIMLWHYTTESDEDGIESEDATSYCPDDLLNAALKEVQHA